MEVNQLSRDHEDGAGLQRVGELFGSFELVSALPAVAGPGRRVWAYRPPTAAHRSRLSQFPARVWTQVDEQLWLSHDSEHLLLSTNGALTQPRPSR